MRIVHVEDFFHPEAGYQLNLLSRLQVKQGHEVLIVTAELEKVPNFLTQFFGKDSIIEKDEHFFRETGVRILRVPLHGFISGRAIFHLRLFKIVDELQPDVAFIHNEDTLTGMQFIWRSKKINYPIVLDCHMLEMASVNRFKYLFRRFYRYFITPIIIKNKIPLIRVTDVDYVEKCLGIPLSHTTLLSFGTDTDYFRPDAAERAIFRKTHDIDENDFVVIYAGKLDVFKGGKFLAEAISRPLICANGRPLVFIIIGNTAGEYGHQVEEIFSKSKNRLLRFPTQTYLDLRTFYQAADLSIFPRQCSMSFYEAQSCGLPVLFEDNEINRQRSGHGNSLLFIPEDIENFRTNIVTFSNMDKSTYALFRENSRTFILEHYDYQPIAAKFTEILERAVDQRKFNKIIT